MSVSVITKSATRAIVTDRFLRRLLGQCQIESLPVTPPWLGQLRQQSLAFASEAKLPSKRDESWRFTGLSDLYQLELELASAVAVQSQAYAPFLLPETAQAHLTLINGRYDDSLSDLSGLPDGVTVSNLSNFSESQLAEIGQYLGKLGDRREIFTALNSAGFSDLAVVWVKRNVTVETPVHLLGLSVPSEIPTLSQPRVLIIAEPGASLDLLEYYSAVTQDCPDVKQNHPYLTNAVTEIWLGENASVNHSRIQRESRDGFHIGNTAIAQNRNSRYTCHEISLGGNLYRHTLNVQQLGEQTETTLNGLVMVGGEQLADTHSSVFLGHPYGTVNQLHKCILDDNGRTVFNGNITVPKLAQMTNASQLNRNLLLSNKSRVNTKPELQITADNVKCAHGATVSQLETDEFFYLRSRGLTEYHARHLLIDAFAAEILEQLSLTSLQKQLTQCVACHTLDS